MNVIVRAKMKVVLTALTGLLVAASVCCGHWDDLLAVASMSTTLSGQVSEASKVMRPAIAVLCSLSMVFKLRLTCLPSRLKMA
jgi:hypothetical protein